MAIPGTDRVGCMPEISLGDTELVRRAWTRPERRVVLRGVLGRIFIALEPLFCAGVFGALTLALIFLPLPSTSTLTRREAAIIISPIFGLAAFAFLVYAIIVLYAPLKALLQTFSPIFIVDGYVRYRRPDRDTEDDSNGYVAVLDFDRRQLAEWPLVGLDRVHDATRPAMLEFSRYGIHRIDGRPTGVIPDRIAQAGVDVARRERRGGR